MSILSIFNIGKERYPALTGVRAIGAAAVFFNHLPFLLGFHFTVDVIVLFFVLSGFLIVYIYYKSAPGLSLGLFNYFINRFARIYPVYFLIVSAEHFMFSAKQQTHANTSTAYRVWASFSRRPMFDFK